MYGASKVQKSKNRFVRTDVLFAELTSDFGGELVVGGGPFREPPTVMQSTVLQYVTSSNVGSGKKPMQAIAKCNGRLEIRLE